MNRPWSTHPVAPGLHSWLRLAQKVSLRYLHSQLMYNNIDLLHL